MKPFLATSTLQELHSYSKQDVKRQKDTPKNDREHIDARPGMSANFAKIPNPKIFDFTLSDGDFPDVAQCATHLELLCAFYQLKQKVSLSVSLDTALGIVPEPKATRRRKYVAQTHSIEYTPLKVRDYSFEDRRGAKWTLYLALAAQRFLLWAEAGEINLKDNAEKKDGASRDSAIPLPPIDVLMVWHALLLNPGWLKTFKLNKLSAIPFPWAAIHKAIDSEQATWPYNLPDASSLAFLEQTGLEADLIEDLTNLKHSQAFQDIIRKHGAIRAARQPRGLTVYDIDRMSNGSNLSHKEMSFLQACRAALDIQNNQIIRDLVQAVERQAAFVERMEGQLWIRSPALERI